MALGFSWLLPGVWAPWASVGALKAMVWSPKTIQLIVLPTVAVTFEGPNWLIWWLLASVPDPASAIFGPDGRKLASGILPWASGPTAGCSSAVAETSSAWPAAA